MVQNLSTSSTVYISVWLQSYLSCLKSIVYFLFLFSTSLYVVLGYINMLPNSCIMWQSYNQCGPMQRRVLIEYYIDPLRRSRWYPPFGVLLETRSMCLSLAYIRSTWLLQESPNWSGHFTLTAPNALQSKRSNKGMSPSLGDMANC